MDGLLVLLHFIIIITIIIFELKTHKTKCVVWNNWFKEKQEQETGRIKQENQLGSTGP